jgi:transcriptional regulator with XRE-family HTH domain
MGRKRPESLTVQESKAVALLIAGYSARDVAIKLKVTPETITNWHKNERFKTAKKQALDTLYNAAMAEMVDGMQLACRELIAIIENPDTPQKTKISAINVLLNHVSRNRVESNVSDVLDIENDTISVDTLIKTATTREELTEAINLKFRHEQWLYNQGNKMTDIEWHNGLKNIVEAISKKVPTEMLEDITETIRSELKQTLEKTGNNSIKITN